MRAQHAEEGLRETVDIMTPNWSDAPDYSDVSDGSSLRAPTRRRWYPG
jgi:hypothetical protein